MSAYVYSEDVVLEAVRQCIEDWEGSPCWACGSDPEDNRLMLEHFRERLQASSENDQTADHYEGRIPPHGAHLALAALEHIGKTTPLHVVAVVYDPDQDEAWNVTIMSQVALAAVITSLTATLQDMAGELYADCGEGQANGHPDPESDAGSIVTAPADAVEDVATDGETD